MPRSRQDYRRRRDALVAALAETLPERRLGRLAAGLHVTLALPTGVDEEAVAARASQAGILVNSVAPYRVVDRTTPPTLVVGFGRIRPADAGQAASALAEVVNDF